MCPTKESKTSSASPMGGLSATAGVAAPASSRPSSLSTSPAWPPPHSTRTGACAGSGPAGFVNAVRIASAQAACAVGATEIPRARPVSASRTRLATIRGWSKTRTACDTSRTITIQVGPNPSMSAVCHAHHRPSHRVPPVTTRPRTLSLGPRVDQALSSLRSCRPPVRQVVARISGFGRAVGIRMGLDLTDVRRYRAGPGASSGHGGSNDSTRSPRRILDDPRLAHTGPNETDLHAAALQHRIDRSCWVLLGPLSTAGLRSSGLWREVGQAVLPVRYRQQPSCGRERRSMTVARMALFGWLVFDLAAGLRRGVPTGVGSPPLGQTSTVQMLYLLHGGR